MLNIKKDFPIFKNNPSLVYLDSTASTQKPSFVIDWINEYLKNNYSNIHRWIYDISIKSEKIYFDSKKKIAEFLWVDSYKEIIYTYNSTYASNILTQSLRLSKFLKKWDKILLSIVEHHANIVPWLILKKEIWINIEYVDIDDNYNLDLQDFKEKYDEKVKVISFTHVSNVTGQIFDLEKVWKLKRKDTLFIIDASQSIPHFKIDIKKLNVDFLYFTGHKILADSWIWVLWWKTKFLEKLNPIFSWGWAISKVGNNNFFLWKLPYKFEPWTPNITWSVSILKALEYIKNIWWIKKIEKIEIKLIKYCLKKFNQRKKIKLIWSNTNNNRIWVFSFIIDWLHSDDIADIMAENNICIRSGQHCVHPFLDKIKITNMSRMSLYIYNNIEDIDKFFKIIDKILKEK